MIWKTKENAALVWDRIDVCTADHVVQQSIGGKTTRDNIVAACRQCNNRRHAPQAAE
jgi:5-methylcytosine-specific restriction endonuclease McrA